VPDESFSDLVRRVRTGDQDAAAELVPRYEPAIRRAVRVRLVDDRLRHQFDSMDVCQSVLASFFVRAALGQFESEMSEQLLELLATMVRNKVANRAQQQRAARRDYRRALWPPT
jgi:RNA polymerase sigma-70 factor (ECF subfamily)